TQTAKSHTGRAAEHSDNSHLALQAKHTEQHEGRLYNIPLEELSAVFPHGLPHRFQQQVLTFNEARVMVRKPALELLAYLKGSNFSHPAVRYVIYGERGTGKTMTLCHVVHYCSRQGWLVLHIPDAHLWVKNCKELLQSSYNKDRLDQPLQASVWLKNFKASNERFLQEIKTQKKYMWGKRECTEEGRPLREVVEQGLARVRSASDAVGVLLRELKQQSHRGSFRLLVAVDGVNALWGRSTLRKEDKSPVCPEELTLVHNLRKMLMNDWSGGAIVTTLSQTGSLFKPSSAYTPQELLGKEGFDALDPFVPIPVPNYSPKEFESCYGYYLERRWLQHEKGQGWGGKRGMRVLGLELVSSKWAKKLDKLNTDFCTHRDAQSFAVPSVSLQGPRTFPPCASGLISSVCPCTPRVST
uniref:Small ribosomal subunit protein mS29 n=1 Tax=Catharus ustulatus TaxID=91951 RepID=A0A8C3UIE8_CATUS